MNTLKKACESEWHSSIQNTLREVQNAEYELTYCGGEHTGESQRARSGSYYTPIDVAIHFWNNFFCLHKIYFNSPVESILKQHVIVEPSVGTGVLFFALLEACLRKGLRPKDFEDIEIIMVDINERVLNFLKEKICALEKSFNIKFSRLSFYCEDFQTLELVPQDRSYLIFGNPPFVSNRPGTSRWKNTYAEFLDVALHALGESGSLQFILPLSFSFSQHYQTLRAKLTTHPRLIALSHYDNIPDSLFNSGKPHSLNSNRSNSQRCSILSILPSNATKVLSTELHRWRAPDRQNFLSRQPEYKKIPVSLYQEQFVRPANENIFRYLRETPDDYLLVDCLDQEGKHVLQVASVARNYVGIRDGSTNGCHNLRCTSTEQFLYVLLIVASDLFFDYWLTVGDGFHLTKSNIYKFPISPALRQSVETKLSFGKDMWLMREKYAKRKVNSGKEVYSFDFSMIAPSLYDKLFHRINLQASGNTIHTRQSGPLFRNIEHQ